MATTTTTTLNSASPHAIDLPPRESVSQPNHPVSELQAARLMNFAVAQKDIIQHEINIYRAHVQSYQEYLHLASGRLAEMNYFIWRCATALEANGFDPVELTPPSNLSPWLR